MLYVVNKKDLNSFSNEFLYKGYRWYRKIPDSYINNDILIISIWSDKEMDYEYERTDSTTTVYNYHGRKDKLKQLL